MLGMRQAFGIFFFHKHLNPANIENYGFYNVANMHENAYIRALILVLLLFLFALSIFTLLLPRLCYGFTPVIPGGV